MEHGHGEPIMTIDQAFPPRERRPIPNAPQTIADLISHYEDGNREALVGMARTLSYRWLLVETIPRNQMRKPVKHELRDAPCSVL
jgi:hypothetical protein